eukprot:12460811-Alexandrium_andersonii.AAC.1
MSASLVGSEMCIRDSPGRGTPLNYTERKCGSPEAGAQVATRAASRGAAPVSYTHLTLPTICSV